MIDVYNNETNQLIGYITDADLKVLADHLEEESLEDQDYYIDQATIDVIGDGQATEHLLGVLRKALGSSDGVEILCESRSRSSELPRRDDEEHDPAGDRRRAEHGRQRDRLSGFGRGLQRARNYALSVYAVTD